MAPWAVGGNVSCNVTKAPCGSLCLYIWPVKWNGQRTRLAIFQRGVDGFQFQARRTGPLVVSMGTWAVGDVMTRGHTEWCLFSMRLIDWYAKCRADD